MDWQEAKALKHLQDSGFFDQILLAREQRFLGEVVSIQIDSDIVKSVTEHKIAIQTIKQLAIMPITTGD